jgi:two-component system OmpR family sensor kinase
MILKSIRWRLQIWYGLILVAVLAGFGLTAYHLERARQLRQIDQELDHRVEALHESLAAPREGGPGRREGPPDEFGPPEFPPPDEPPRGRPPPDGFRPRRGGPPPKFQQRIAQTGLFEGAKSNTFYYVVWRRTGEVIERSANAPANIRVPDGSEKKAVRVREQFREAFQFTPMGECVLAGLSLAGEMGELRRFAWWLGAVGGGVLLLGLAGGGWIAAYAIRPIEAISATSVKIAAGDLSQRINIADTDTELGRLAGVLNSTFARLEAAFAQQGRFTFDAAHELRTPLSAILTQTQTALGRERTAFEFRKTVEACERSAQRMRRLIESLLELARLDAGQEPMKRARFDLSRTARECIERVRPLAEERGIQIHCDGPAVACDGDAERLAEVITHLLTNAIEYNQDHGEVRVTTQAQGGQVVLAVADTGEGIAADDLPHIFERFYRAGKSRASAPGRAGLGLAISKAIMAAHGGSIEATSQPGAGAIFTIRLPTESNARL